MHDFKHISITRNELNLPQMPGFVPAAELVVWRVPKGAIIVVEEKDPKPLTPHPASLNGTDAVFGRAV